MRTIIALACASFIAGAATIQVAPNILVSRESGLPKVELTVAANPKNAKNLIGTGIAATPFTEGCTVYTSFDGGYSWKPVVPPGLPETGSGDPQVLFTDDGTAYFSALGLIREETGRQRFVDFLFRSRDGGLTWDKIATFGAGTGPDHDMLVADSAGRVFISLVYQQGGESNIGVYRLEPGGSAVTGPVRVATGAGAAVFTWNPVVFSDGSLFVLERCVRRRRIPIEAGDLHRHGPDVERGPRYRCASSAAPERVSAGDCRKSRGRCRYQLARYPRFSYRTDISRVLHRVSRWRGDLPAARSCILGGILARCRRQLRRAPDYRLAASGFGWKHRVLFYEHAGQIPRWRRLHGSD